MYRILSKLVQNAANKIKACYQFVYQTMIIAKINKKSTQSKADPAALPAAISQKNSRRVQMRCLFSPLFLSSFMARVKKINVAIYDDLAPWKLFSDKFSSQHREPKLIAHEEIACHISSWNRSQALSSVHRQRIYYALVFLGILQVSQTLPIMTGDFWRKWHKMLQ